MGSLMVSSFLMINACQKSLVTFSYPITTQLMLYASITFFLPAQETCHSYLDNETSYFLGDTEWFDDRNCKYGFSLITGLVDVFKNAMNQ
jgi:hypothetical protein